MSDEWKIEDNQPNSMGNFSIVTKSEIQTQVAVAVTEDIAVGIVRDHNAHAALVEALANPNLICRECDFSRRKNRNDTPEHMCPEAAVHAAVEEAKR